MGVIDGSFGLVRPRFDPGEDYDEVIRCEDCGGRQMHPTTVRVCTGTGDAVITSKGMQEIPRDHYPYRGVQIQLWYRCEECDAATLELRHFHKGITYAEYQHGQDGPGAPHCGQNWQTIWRD